MPSSCPVINYAFDEGTDVTFQNVNVSLFVNCLCITGFSNIPHLRVGSAPDKPNIYDFSTTYHEMYQDLAKKDKSLYTQNGILHMLDRNRRIKPRPER